MREAVQQRWFPKDARGIFPPTAVSERLNNGRKKVADLALVKASVEDGRFFFLNAREQRLLNARFFPKDDLTPTLGQIAEELGLGSASSARRAQEQILKKLRQSK